MKNSDDDFISLLLNSYGNGDGLGTYIFVEDILLKLSKSKVILELKNILENPNIADSIRYWATQNAAVFPDISLIKGLNLSLLSNAEDIRDSAKVALQILSSIER